MDRIRKNTIRSVKLIYKLLHIVYSLQHEYSPSRDFTIQKNHVKTAN